MVSKSRIVLIAGLVMVALVAGIAVTMMQTQPISAMQNTVVKSDGSTGKSYTVGLNESLSLKEKH